MGLLSYLRGDDLLEDRSTDAPSEARSLPRPDNELPLSGLPAVWSGSTFRNLRPVDALAIADVWAAVRVLADAVSSLPLHVYRKTDTGRERVTSGRLVDLLERPSPGVSEADLASTLMTHLAVWGNGYIGKFRQQGEVTQLALLHPDRIRPELQDGQPRFRYSPGTGPQQLLTEADICYVKGLSTDSLNGLSAVSQAACVLGLSDSLVQHAMGYFESDTPLPAGVLRLNPEATEAQRSTNIEGLRNEARPHGVLVIRGDADYLPIANKLDDAQFVEQRRLACQEIARVFRVPSHMLNAGTGGDSLTYATSESMSIDFVKYTLAPWLRRIELALSGDADLAFAKQYVRFELDGLLRADSKTRAEIYEKALDPVSGWMSRDEVRKLEDLPPEPGGPPQTAQVLNGMPIAAQNGASNGNS